jgi:hypothetical protein
MARKLPQDIQALLDRVKIPTPKELVEILSRLTPEQRQMLDKEISDGSAKFRRSQFRLVSGGRRRRLRLGLLTDPPE